MERSGPTPSAFGRSRAGWRLALLEWHRKSTCCCCGTRPLPDYCWTAHIYVLVGIGLPSTPFAANFGPGPEGAAVGRAAGRRCFFPLLAADVGSGPKGAAAFSGLARRGRRRGAHLDGEFAFYASRR